MTKEIYFDLEFDEIGVIALTHRGLRLVMDAATNWDIKGLYRVAIYKGLHVRFSSAQVRDEIIDLAPLLQP